MTAIDEGHVEKRRTPQGTPTEEVPARYDTIEDKAARIAIFTAGKKRES